MTSSDAATSTMAASRSLRLKAQGSRLTAQAEGMFDDRRFWHGNRCTGHVAEVGKPALKERRGGRKKHEPDPQPREQIQLTDEKAEPHQGAAGAEPRARLERVRAR